MSSSCTVVLPQHAGIHVTGKYNRKFLSSPTDPNSKESTPLLVAEQVLLFVSSEAVALQQGGLG